MRERYVVDTNVLIAASAADPLHPKDIDATPTEPEERLRVWEWLSNFSDSESRMVLDKGLKISKEYENKLTFNDFGIQVLMHKWSMAQVDNVPIEYDENGDGRIPTCLEPVVHDLADRKIVAAAIVSQKQYGEGCVAFAGDTDWHEWEEELISNQVLLEPIIEEWSRRKFEEKKKRKQGAL
ncbi:TPA: hypothetical protein ACN32Z_004625 [Vibrio parahaemolyticus]